MLRENQISKARQRPLIKNLVYLLKLLITGYILYRVFKNVQLGEIIGSMTSLPLGVVLAVLVGSALRHWIQYQNWSHALRLNPTYQIDRKEVLSSYLVGLPLRFAIPGGSASMGKIFWVQNSSRLASLLAFAAERGFLTWSTWVFASGAAMFHYQSISPWIRIPVFILCLVLPLLVYPILRLSSRGKDARPHYKKLAPRMAMLQITAGLITFTQYWLLLNQHLKISWPHSLRLMALTNFSNSIPITLAGLGLRESFAVHFLAKASFSASQAISTTLTLFVIQDMIPALIGLGVFFTRKKSQLTLPPTDK